MMKPLRSLLFVPGHRGTWVEKAINAGVDGVLLDLEDSVPENLKQEAREEVARSIRRVRENGSDIPIYVRVNALDTKHYGDDIQAVLVPGLNGLALPKTYGAEDIVRFDAITTHFEMKNELPAGSIEFICNLETAEAYANCEAMAVASPRVATLFAGTARDADVSRSIGFQFTPEGTETLYLRSRAVLAARAAGLEFPLVGVWQDLKDPEGARNFSEQNRRLGFKGQVLIHPSHIDVANEVFAPTKFEIDFYQGMIDAFDEAVAGGAAAVVYEGMHVDYAHIKTAREVIDYAKLLGANNAEKANEPVAAS
jgi:citrate lyase subunit beta/citryl-CoA lyase